MLSAFQSINLKSKVAKKIIVILWDNHLRLKIFEKTRMFYLTLRVVWHIITLCACMLKEKQQVW